MYVNWHLIASPHYARNNQPMIDVAAMPQPERFTNFAAWLKAVCAINRGKQREVAGVCGVKPQAVTKWLKGGKIDIAKLKLLSGWSGIDYVKLRSLADGENPKETDVGPNRRLMTHTEMGAKVGRKWEELAEPAKTQMLNVIETMLALQKESHRMYAKQQMEIAKARSKAPV
jgi:transcriptional regulator with XRE-family HTH domain